MFSGGSEGNIGKKRVIKSRLAIEKFMKSKSKPWDVLYLQWKQKCARLLRFRISFLEIF